MAARANPGPAACYGSAASPSLITLDAWRQLEFEGVRAELKEGLYVANVLLGKGILSRD